MTKRPPNLTEKYASALLELQRLRGDPIDREDAKAMTAGQICRLFHADHYPVRREMGGSNHPTNLIPRFIGEHRVKTAKIDQPEMAHNRKVDDAVAEHRRKLLAKTVREPGKDPEKRKTSWPKRSMFSEKQKETIRRVRADRVAERRLRRKGQS